MDEIVCQITAELQKNGEITAQITGDPDDVVRCLGGLILAAADYTDMSVENLAEDASACAVESEMEWKGREDEQV